MTKEVTTRTPERGALDPMLEAALLRLAEVGPKWTEAEQDRWCSLFAAIVKLIYPAKAPRKSRAKKENQA